MQDQQEISRHPDPRNMPGKQWLVIHQNQYRRQIQPFIAIEAAKAAAWLIVEDSAEQDGFDIRDFRAAGDLWGAWDAVCGGEGSLTIEQIDLPAGVVAVALSSAAANA
jgi:hypothetical protein